MLTGTLHTWVTRHIAVRQRLERVCTSYVLFLMVATTKHSLTEAARFSGLHPSLFAKLLQSHAQVAITTLESLSKTQARQFAKTLARVKGLPWKIVIIIDSTLQHRASLHPENAQTFKHGKGYVIGHQWTNVVLVLGDMLIPLKPIPFYSKRYCQAHELTYRSEHEFMWLAVALAIEGNRLEGNQHVAQHQDDVGPLMPDDIPLAVLECLGVFRMQTGP